MEQVIIFADQVNSTVTTLAKSLADLKKEVLLITSAHRSSDEDLENIQVWSYFKTWSLFEVIKLMPRLVLKKPSTVQFFLSDEKAQKAFIILQTLWAKKNDCIVSMSFLSSELLSKNPKMIKETLPLSDIVTVPNLSSLQQLRGRPAKTRQLKTILPPFLSLPKKRRSQRQPQSWGLEKNFLLLPYSPDLLDKKNWLHLSALARSTSLMIWMDRAENDLLKKKALLHFLEELNLSDQVHPLYLSAAELIEFSLDNISHNLGFILAHLELHAEQLTHLIEMSIEMQSPLILNEIQAAQYSQLFTHGENSWVFQRKTWAESLKNLLQLQGDHFRLSHPLQKNSEIQNKLIDTFFNDLSRIYARAQQLKS